MKQDKNNLPDINLEAIDRELAALGQKKAATADPLAELARIMGQNDPFTGLDRAVSSSFPVISSGQSLDDILNAPPSSVLRRDEVQSNFDAELDQMVSAKIGRNAKIDDDWSQKQQTEISSELAEDEGLADASLKGADDYDIFERDDLSDAANIDALEAAMASERAALTAANQKSAEIKTSTSAPQFDDMLAEFESAMRDAGGEKITTVSSASLAPSVVPPPPEELLYQQNEPRTSDFSTTGLAGAAAAGAAVIASGSLAKNIQQQQNHEPFATYQEKKPKRGLMIAGGVIGIAVIGISALFAFGGPKSRVNGPAPVIAAKTGATKERPVNPGGVDVPNQDKEVLKAPSTSPVGAERVVPREEQPVDLKQAQSAAVVTPPVVRQILGVGAVPTNAAPSASPPNAAPVSPSLAGSQPVPRPVASVPIAIAGSPAPAAPVAAPVPITPPVAPVAAAPTPSPAAPVVAAVRPPAAETPAAPRRVQTVPIRPDAEAAPRPQARPATPAPRVAPAPEPDAANAPLRITPQALRGTQRVASSAPAQPSGVAARPETNSGGGSGFSVQLGAEGSAESARSKFNRIKSDHSSVLGSQNANIRNADVNGRTVYRIRVGNMSREQAVGMCERLKADGGNCFVARN